MYVLPGTVSFQASCTITKKHLQREHRMHKPQYKQQTQQHSRTFSIN